VTGSSGTGWLPLVPILAAAVGYGFLARRLRRRGDHWSAGRSAAGTGGFAALALAVSPPVATAMTFPAHALQHLLIAMLAPLLLALSAPVTLALRTLPAAGRSVLVRAVHCGPAGLLLRGPAVLILEVGGMYAYYLSPLYAATHDRPWLHAAVHAHMFLSGCLFTWFLVGRDPVPARPALLLRTLVLLIAAGSHDVLAKLMYARLLPSGAGTATQLRLGAEILFYGGDLIEVGLAAAMLATWYGSKGRELARQERRATRAPVRTADVHQRAGSREQ
jgi:putative membrane protein